MKKKKIGVLVSAIATCAVCVSMVAGSTFALFTDEDSVGVAVTAATVKVDVEIADKSVTSAIDPAAEVYGGFTGTDGLTLTDVTPGETYSFTVKATNASSIAALCKTSVVFSNTALASAFQVTIGETEYGAVKSYSTAWTRVEAETALEDLSVEITFPYSVDSQNEFQGLKTDIAVKVEAVQANAQGYTAGGEPEVVEIPADAKVVSTAENLKTAIEEGGYVVLSQDIEIDQKAVIANDTTLDLNGYTIVSNVEEGRLFSIGTSETPCDNVTFIINGAGGTVEIPDENTECYGVVDMYGENVNVVVNEATLVGNTNDGAFFKSRMNGWSIELNDVICETNYNITNNYGVAGGTIIVNGGKYTLSGTNNYAGFRASGGCNVTMTNVTFVTDTRLPMEVSGGTAVITDCVIGNPVDNSVAKWLSSAVGISGGARVTIKSGYYRGSQAAYVFNSGGVFDIHGGTFISDENGHVLRADANRYDQAQRPSLINVYDGEFDGKLYAQKGYVSGETTYYDAKIIIYGGTFKNTGLSAEEFAQYVDESSTYTYDEATDTYTVKAD